MTKKEKLIDILNAFWDFQVSLEGEAASARSLIARNPQMEAIWGAMVDPFNVQSFVARIAEECADKWLDDETVNYLHDLIKHPVGIKLAAQMPSLIKSMQEIKFQWGRDIGTSVAKLRVNLDG